MFTGNYKKRIELFKKAFHRKCLFCEMIIEASVEGFGKKESKTVLNLCEFCLNKYQVLEELRQDENNSKKIIEEISNCCYGKCYFCSEETVKWEVEINSSASQPKGGFFGGKLLGVIHSCKGCSSKYNSLCEFEQEKKRLDVTEQRLRKPPKDN